MEVEKKGIEVPWSGVGHTYTDAEVEFVTDLMRNTYDTYTEGKYLKKFEERFCEFNGNKFAFAVSSCTSALELAAILSRVDPGDEVIIRYKVKVVVQYYPLYRYHMFQKAGFGDADCLLTDDFF